MIDSAAVANQQAALSNVQYFIPLVISDRIQLNNIIRSVKFFSSYYKYV